MARETENLGLYLADDEDTFQNYVKNQSASMNHNMEILDSYIYKELNDKVNKDDYATTSAAGLVKPDGTTVTVDADGTIHGAQTYELPTASASVKGGIKVGDHLHMNGDVLSADGGIAVQDEEPTDVDVWIDIDEEGADFCYVGDTEPPDDGSVAIWVDTSEDFIPPVSDAVDYVVEQGTIDGWTYEKWASGKIEMWTNDYAVTMNAWTSWVAPLYYTYVTVNFPITLASDDFYAEAQCDSSNFGMVCSIRKRTTAKVEPCIARPNNTATSTTLSVRVIGRWK